MQHLQTMHHLNELSAILTDLSQTENDIMVAQEKIYEARDHVAAAQNLLREVEGDLAALERNKLDCIDRAKKAAAKVVGVEATKQVAAASDPPLYPVSDLPAGSIFRHFGEYYKVSYYDRASRRVCCNSVATKAVFPSDTLVAAIRIGNPDVEEEDSMTVPVGSLGKGNRFFLPDGEVEWTVTHFDQNNTEATSILEETITHGSFPNSREVIPCN